MLWNINLDEVNEPLNDKSHRPHTRHPNAHTAEEIKWIRYNHRRHLKILVCELYGKFRSNKEYSRHPNSLYDMYGHLSYSSAASSIKKMRKPQLFDILTKLGAK